MTAETRTRNHKHYKNWPADGSWSPSHPTQYQPLKITDSEASWHKYDICQPSYVTQNNMCIKIAQPPVKIICPDLSKCVFYFRPTCTLRCLFAVNFITRDNKIWIIIFMLSLIKTVDNLGIFWNCLVDVRIFLSEDSMNK